MGQCLGGSRVEWSVVAKMVKSLCEGDEEGKIGALIAIMTISILSVVVVSCYALCFIRRRRMITEQRMFEASEREVVAFQDVNLLLTYMAYLQSHGVSMESTGEKIDLPADRRRLMIDPKLDDLRKQILQRIVVFYGYEPEPGQGTTTAPSSSSATTTKASGRAAKTGSKQPTIGKKAIGAVKASVERAKASMQHVCDVEKMYLYDDGF